VADQYTAKEFTNVKALEGGVAALEAAGYGVVPPP
jgi:rhodanese-related sulfurtransferase